MEQRIKAGDFSFPPREWSKISIEAKNLILGMLETIPEKRFSIEDVTKSKWILVFTTNIFNCFFKAKLILSTFLSYLQNNTQVPKTELSSIQILNNNKENWNEINQNIHEALNGMRIDYDKGVKVKNLNETDNPLLKRRQEKLKNNKIGMIEKNQDYTKEDSNQKRMQNSPNTTQSANIVSLPNKTTPISALYYSSSIFDNKKDLLSQDEIS